MFQSFLTIQIEFHIPPRARAVFPPCNKRERFWRNSCSYFKVGGDAGVDRGASPALSQYTTSVPPLSGDFCAFCCQCQSVASNETSHNSQSHEQIGLRWSLLLLHQSQSPGRELLQWWRSGGDWRHSWLGAPWREDEQWGEEDVGVRLPSGGDEGSVHCQAGHKPLQLYSGQERHHEVVQLLPLHRGDTPWYS